MESLEAFFTSFANIHLWYNYTNGCCKRIKKECSSLKIFINKDKKLRIIKVSFNL